MTVVADASPASSRILFVGNSFVSRNDLPGIVARLAASAGYPVETKSIVAGGASLRRHLNAGTVADALEQSRWDFMVLQEQSTLPLKPGGRVVRRRRDSPKRGRILACGLRHLPDAFPALDDCAGAACG